MRCKDTKTKVVPNNRTRIKQVSKAEQNTVEYWFKIVKKTACFTGFFYFDFAIFRNNKITYKKKHSFQNASYLRLIEHLFYRFINFD